MKKHPITVEAVIRAPITKVWKYWNDPNHIVQWAFASDDWEAPFSQNDLRVGGAFKTTMSAKDKSASFDFEGIYSVVNEHALIEYDLPDKRHIRIEFSEIPQGTKVVEIFDPEGLNTEERQRAGWQAILNNFKKHVETS